MSILFEYGNWLPIEDRKGLQSRLNTIWQSQKNNTPAPTEEGLEESKYQPFLQFDGNMIRAKNFVGFIQHGKQTIEIYPKVFRSHFPNPDSREKASMLRHILYWLSYSRKWKFTFDKASLDSTEIDCFPELIISLIANSFLEVVSTQPLTMYQETEEALTSPRGSINFHRYTNNSLSRGKNHIVECDLETFLFDNSVNRIIKFCTRRLLEQAKFPETLRALENLIFLFVEVEDRTCTLSDVEKVRLNPFFEDYYVLMDYCKIILNQELYSESSSNSFQWCLLLPMEYIFEDFVAGFLEKHFAKDWKVEYQKSDMYLSSEPKVFQIQHDIFVTYRKNPDFKILIDTKYKLREKDFQRDPKKGVAQTDLYQMFSYASKRGCENVILIYPNINETLSPSDRFRISIGFSGEHAVNVVAQEIPFVNQGKITLNEQLLIETISNILNSILLNLKSLY